MEWVFYFLLFFFGYMTARTFYFVKASRLSITLIRVSQIVALGMLAKSMEHFQYSKTYRLNAMALNGETEHNMQAFEYQINEDVKHFKDKAILKMVECHKGFFSELVEFTDWTSAMKFLDEHKTAAIAFFRRDS
jgi:hypothetical protein|tara:strand:+ start:271 stop:672 length:402 start_codon:yes stop_codon:yes gene_type:complete